MSDKKGSKVHYVIFIILFILLIAFLVPSIYTAQESPKTLSIEQSETSEKAIHASVYTTLTNVSESSVNLTIRNIHTSDRVTIINLTEGTEQNITVSNSVITVANTEIIDNRTAIIEYSYPVYLGWPDGAKFLIENTQMIILAIFLLMLLVLVFSGKGEN